MTRHRIKAIDGVCAVCGRPLGFVGFVTRKWRFGSFSGVIGFRYHKRGKG